MKQITDAVRFFGVITLFMLGACQIDRGPWTHDPEYQTHVRKIAELKDRRRFLESQLAVCQNRLSGSAAALVASGVAGDVGAVHKGLGFGSSVMAANSAVVGGQHGIAGLRPLTRQEMRGREEQIKAQIQRTEKEIQDHCEKKEAIQQKYSAAQPPSTPGKKGGNPPPIMPQKPMFDGNSDRGGKEYLTNPARSKSTMQ